MKLVDLGFDLSLSSPGSGQCLLFLTGKIATKTIQVFPPDFFVVDGHDSSDRREIGGSVNYRTLIFDSRGRGLSNG
ncbi:hypothetical protein, partial [uncultured Rothia sp.]|uniref:hypothetical protein n=1 Tax=uncultured Rothia sp. TaxID=316088 RepID=UPI0028DC19C9